MIKRLKEKATRKNIIFLLTAVVVLLGSSIFIIYAQNNSGYCPDGSSSCLNATTFQVGGNGYVAKDLFVNAGDNSKGPGRLVVMSGGAESVEKFSVDADGVITSPTIKDVSGSNPICGSGLIIAKKWNAQAWTAKILSNDVSCNNSDEWVLSQKPTSTPVCNMKTSDGYYLTVNEPSNVPVVPTGCFLEKNSFINGTITQTYYNFRCYSQNWNRAICVGD